MNLRTSALVLALLAAVLAAAGCSARANSAATTQPARPTSPPPPPPKVIETSTGGTLIRMNSTAARHFPLVRARAVEIARHFTAPGSVAADVSRTVAVYSLANGFAVQVPAELGAKVKQGQILAVVSSPDLAKAISTDQTARAEETLDDKQLKREQSLYAHGATPHQAVEAAQFADQRARIEVQAAAREIRLLGGDPNSPSDLVQVRAPITGTIIRQNISRGQAVENTYLFRIADLSRVWVLCSIYENQLSRVRVGDNARLTFSAYPKRVFLGRITNIARILNAATRTAAVRVVLANPHGRLMPGMFATATFTSTRPTLHIVVPVNALFQLHGQYWLFRPAKAGQFRRIPVRVGTVDTPGWETITSGLKAGQRVVANSFGFAAAAAAAAARG